MTDPLVRNSTRQRACGGPNCGRSIAPHLEGWTRGTPRRYCSTRCRTRASNWRQLGRTWEQAAPEANADGRDVIAGGEYPLALRPSEADAFFARLDARREQA